MHCKFRIVYRYIIYCIIRPLRLIVVFANTLDSSQIIAYHILSNICVFHVHIVRSRQVNGELKVQLMHGNNIDGRFACGKTKISLHVVGALCTEGHYDIRDDVGLELIWFGARCTHYSVCY